VRHFSGDRIQIVHGASGLCLAIGDNDGSYVKLRSCEYGDSWHVNHFASIFSFDPSNMKAIDTHEFTLISGEHDDKPLFELFGCQPEDVATIRPLMILGGSVDPELPSWPAMAGANVNICGDGFSALDGRWWFDSEPSEYPGDPGLGPASLPVGIHPSVTDAEPSVTAAEPAHHPSVTAAEPAHHPSVTTTPCNAP